MNGEAKFKYMNKWIQYPSIYPSIHLSVCPFVRSSVCLLSIHPPSIHSSIHVYRDYRQLEVHVYI